MKPTIKEDLNQLRIWDNNYLISDYKILGNLEYIAYDHYLTIDAEISDETDLILFLREDQFDTGDISTSDYYQFNDYGMNGCDLIDLCKAYDIREVA